MEAKEVLVDTSSILFGFASKRNVFEALEESMPEYVQVISRGVVRELEKFSNSRLKRRPEATVALAYITRSDLHIDDSSEHVDSWIEKRAERKRSAVCTNDIKLKRGLKAAGVEVFSIARSGRIR